MSCSKTYLFAFYLDSGGQYIYIYCTYLFESNYYILPSSLRNFCYLFTLFPSLTFYLNLFWGHMRYASGINMVYGCSYSREDLFQWSKAQRSCQNISQKLAWGLPVRYNRELLWWYVYFMEPAKNINIIDYIRSYYKSKNIINFISNPGMELFLPVMLYAFHCCSRHFNVHFYPLYLKKIFIWRINVIKMHNRSWKWKLDL